MSTAICARENCQKIVYARGLCASDYQKARLLGKLPPSDVVDRPCSHCGQLMVGRKYANAKFCDRKCKDDFYAAASSARSLEAKAGRLCTECSAPIPPTVTAKAKTCSRECGVAYQNRLRQERKRADWEARKPPCARCGGEIPIERPIGSKFCSFQCKHLAASARYREKVPGYQRMRNYGVTPERFAEMIAKQGGRCAICGAVEPGGKGTWHVDHCHDSGVVRDLLCSNCNIGLGNFKDNPNSLQAAIAYLERHGVTAART